MSTQTEVVYRAVGCGGGSTMIHLDEDCEALGRAEVIEKPAEVFPDWFDRCSRCWE